MVVRLCSVLAASLLVAGLACSNGISGLVDAVDVGDSTLQFRIVLRDEAGTCSESFQNPKASSEVTVSTLRGTCLRLGPAQLEIRKLEAAVEESGQDSDVVLSLALPPPETQRFAEITAGNLNRRLAMVMFGRVLTTPTVQQPIVGGRVGIGGLTREEAEALAAELEN